MRGVIRRERDSSLRTSLIRKRHNFLGIRVKNVNFVLCEFQNRNSKYSCILFVISESNLETDIEGNFMFFSLNLREFQWQI